MTFSLQLFRQSLGSKFVCHKFHSQVLLMQVEFLVDDVAIVVVVADAAYEMLCGLVASGRQAGRQAWAHSACCYADMLVLLLLLPLPVPFLIPTTTPITTGLLRCRLLSLLYVTYSKTCCGTMERKNAK